MGNSSGTTLTIISFDLIGCYFSDHSTCGLSKWTQKSGELGATSCGYLPDHSLNGFIGSLYSFHGNWNLTSTHSLVIYAIFPILENTITALNGIDPSLEEAGIAFGMTKWERLKKFEIPLAMPVVMSGVRTSAVMIIGTATLAALIGAGGLGSFILLGIDRRIIA